MDTKVIDSRLSEDGRSVKRRRECERCSFRFTTFEKIKVAEFFVLKNSGEKEVYSRIKLLRGVSQACKKRPIAIGIIEEQVAELEEIWNTQGEISSKNIGRDTMMMLKRLDQVAYVRFASIYLDFQDVQTFEKILANIDDDDAEKLETLF